MKRLSDIPLPKIYDNADVLPMNEVLDKEIVIEDATLLSGNFGDFVVILLKFPDKDERWTVTVGGYEIVRRCVKAREEKLFPLSAVISKEGRKYVVK